MTRDIVNERTQLRGTVHAFMVRSGATTMALRVLGVGLGYVVNILLSRFLGLHGYGVYAIALGWVLVLTLPARMGFDNSALRYVTIYFERRDAGSLRGFIHIAIWSVAIASVVIGAAMTFVSQYFGPGSSAVARASLIVLPLSLLGLVSVMMRAARSIVASQLYDQLLRPTLLIFLLIGGALAEVKLSPEDALMLTAIAALLALAASAVHFRRLFRWISKAPADYSSWRHWFALSLPFLFMGLVQELMNQLEVVLLGLLADARQAGLFAAAWRLASLIPFALVALTTVGGPLVASAYDRGDKEELQKIARLNARLSLGFALVASLALVIGGRLLLRLFGEEFVAAYPALLVLSIGGVANAYTGIVAYLMTLTGRERPALLIFLGALCISLTLNLLLITRLGVLGAAIASSSAVAFWNIVMLVYVRCSIGIDASALGLRPREVHPA